MANSQPSIGLSRSYLAAFFNDSVKEFEQALEAKLQSINQPRFTMASPGRSFVLKVHSAVFTATLAQRFVNAEVLHHPPTDNLLYRVLSLSRFRAVTGKDGCLVRRNNAGDFSVLTPTAVVGQDDFVLEKGAIGIPLVSSGRADNKVLVVFPDMEQPLTSLGKMYHKGKDIGRACPQKGDRFFRVQLKEDLMDWAEIISPGDAVVLRAVEYGVMKVEQLSESILFLDVDRAVHFTATKSRPTPVHVCHLVRVRGRRLAVEKSLLKVLHPVDVKFKAKESCLSVSAHTMCFNGFGNPTVRTFIPPEDVEVLPNFS